MPTSTAGDRNHNGHGLECRRRLIEAAAALFAEQGCARTRIADLAAFVGACVMRALPGTVPVR